MSDLKQTLWKLTLLKLLLPLSMNTAYENLEPAGHYESIMAFLWIFFNLSLRVLILLRTIF